MGHVLASRLQFLVSTRALENLKTHDISDCSGCKLVNFFALPFIEVFFFSLVPFDLVHSDVWGPYSVTIKEGS